MAEEAFFSGKLRRIQLPVFTQPTGPDAPLLKRLLLPQGELAQFHEADEGMHYMALLELKEGGVRGNHYHRQKREYVYVISGKVELLAENLADRAQVSLSLAAGELAIIETNIGHALRTVEAGSAIEFSPSRFDRTDVYRYPLI
jgi:quercetin dioxygenase-like cupin family protein